MAKKKPASKKAKKPSQKPSRKASSKRPPKRPIVPPPGAPTGDDAARPLTDIQQAFVDEWMLTRNSFAAYRRVRPDLSARSCQSHASNLRRHPAVDAEIRARLAELRLRRTVEATQVIKETERIAFSDVAELFDPNTLQLRHPTRIPFDTRMAIASIKVSKQRQRITTTRPNATSTTRTVTTESIIEYRFWNKLDALAKLGRRYGLDMEITPLDTLLNLLPRPLAIEVRAAIVESLETKPKSDDPKALVPVLPVSEVPVSAEEPKP